jgi:hypothetical protein
MIHRVLSPCHPLLPWKDTSNTAEALLLSHTDLLSNQPVNSLHILAHVSAFLQMIAGATAALVRAMHPTVSKHKTATALMLTPIQPLMVTSANTAGVEVNFPPSAASCSSDLA